MLFLLALSAMSAQARTPRITSFELAPTTCSEWQLDVEARGRARAVLSTSDQIIARWRPSARPHYTRSGGANPGDDVSFSLRVGRERETRTITIPPYPIAVTPTVTLFPSERSEHTLEAELTDPCGAYARAKVDARVGSDVAYAYVSGGRVTVALPGQAPGVYPVELRLLTRDDVLMHVETVQIEVTARSLDGDGDGFLPSIAGGRDCNDSDSSVHPDATEGTLANGVDDDCNGTIDDGTTAYDDDGDGVSEDDGDCNDSNAKVYPGAPELWDCQDQDCDGEVDEGVDTSTPPRDTYEPNNTDDTSADLKTLDLRHFTRNLDLWVDGTSDIETFRFYSHDGLFDNWGIWVSATSRGVGTRYELRLSIGERVAATTFDDTTQLLHMTGLAGLEDSGVYTLSVRSLNERSCPLTLRVRSN